MKNQIVVITGSTRGLGYAMAEAMLKAGAAVVISGRSAEAVQKAVKTLSKHGRVEGRRCDVRQERQVYALARWAVRHLGRIDVWINNAGYSAFAGHILDMPPREAIDMFLANDMGTFHGTRAALHFMLPRKQGTLVNVYGNGSFLRPASPTALYGATKAWMTSFSRSLAKEIKGSGVEVVGFSPGMLLTDMLTSPTVIGQQGRDMLKDYGFVLRLLAHPPEWAAEKLVSILRSNGHEFVEYRGFKPWTPLVALARIGWENLTHTGSRPTYKLRVLPAYRPEI
jgi:NAD(P)-dependent dehydrogenase (short-subunit alcohol dehydrogenase family)